MVEVKIPSRAIWWCLSVYCIADIVWGCGSVAAAPQEDSELPQGEGRENMGGGEEGSERHCESEVGREMTI